MATITDFKVKLNIRKDIEYVRIENMILRITLDINENLEPHFQYSKITDTQLIDTLFAKGKIKDI